VATQKYVQFTSRQSVQLGQPMEPNISGSWKHQTQAAVTEPSVWVGVGNWILMHFRRSHGSTDNRCTVPPVKVGSHMQLVQFNSSHRWQPEPGTICHIRIGAGNWCSWTAVTLTGGSYRQQCKVPSVKALTGSTSRQSGSQRQSVPMYQSQVTSVTAITVGSWNLKFYTYRCKLKSEANSTAGSWNLKTIIWATAGIEDNSTAKAESDWRQYYSRAGSWKINSITCTATAWN
jgi:hypothetical protein